MPTAVEDDILGLFKSWTDVAHAMASTSTSTMLPAIRRLSYISKEIQKIASTHTCKPAVTMLNVMTGMSGPLSPPIVSALALASRREMCMQDRCTFITSAAAITQVRDAGWLGSITGAPRSVGRGFPPMSVTD
jgi:hypothetical protein